MSTFIRPTAYFVRRTSFSYSKKNQKKIATFFPKESQLAFEETHKCISFLISCLKSEITPKNFSRAKISKEITDFHKSITKFEYALNALLKSPTAPSTVKIKGAYYKIRDFVTAEQSLKSMRHFLSTTKRACEVALKDLDKIPGKKNHHFMIAIERLAAIWVKYGNKATLVNTNPASGPVKPSGKFYHYVKLSIDSALKSKRIKIQFSYEDIIKEVLYPRESQEQISQK